MNRETIRDTVKDAIDFELQNQNIFDGELKYILADAVLESLGFTEDEQDEPLDHLRIKIKRRVK